ncbi:MULTISPECIES: TRAP transporter large permease [Anaerotruncus]|jgi:C4-dicarboxylate transporter DctM subunit|uniref:TRAP transporter large permease n=1 Tax=Anaerotruncus TaxID=244127 RepID=UPI00082DC011|nr:MULTISPECIES: TRAP transporter large permease [Anaerotruncus]RGX56567.1 TRAP transporter large permease [Anaerotruncus sp. AF02-27]
MNAAVFFILFLVLLAIGTPMSFTFCGLALLPNLLNSNFQFDANSVLSATVGGLNSFILLGIPLFMLAGVLMAKGGISEKLFGFFAYFIGNKTAGFPATVIITCLFFGAISGSSAASVAAVGAMTIPFLVKLGYDKVFSTAVVTVAGGLGVIIPPSISYIIFSSVSNTSPASLFIAGILPGCLIAAGLICYAYYYCKRKGEDKQTIQMYYQEIRQKGLWKLFRESFFALLTPVIILGSIYGGIASPTEAAAISVIYAFAVSLFAYKSIRFQDIPALFVEGSKSFINLFFILGAATAFTRVVTLSGYATEISNFILSSYTGKVGILLLLNLIMLIFGAVMDNIPNIMLLTPVLLPVATGIGMDPIHFGIIMTANLAIGMVTPPVGVNLYVGSGMSNIPILKLAKATIPFLLTFVISLLAITFIPGISLWLVG